MKIFPSLSQSALRWPCQSLRVVKTLCVFIRVFGRQGRSDDSATCVSQSSLQKDDVLTNSTDLSQTRCSRREYDHTDNARSNLHSPGLSSRHMFVARRSCAAHSRCSYCSYTSLSVASARYNSVTSRISATAKSCPDE